jgi:hypothetical protein
LTQGDNLMMGLTRVRGFVITSSGVVNTDLTRLGRCSTIGKITIRMEARGGWRVGESRSKSRNLGVAPQSGVVGAIGVFEFLR